MNMNATAIEFHRHAVEVPDAQVVGGKSADGDGTEGVADRIERAHAGEPVSQRAEYRDSKINVPQRLGRLGNPRGQARVLDRPGGFGPVELHAADAEHGQYGHRENDDAQAAEPLQLLAVVENRFGQLVEPRQYRCPGGGQPGHGFEDRVGEA